MDNIHIKRQPPMPILSKMAISPAYEERLKAAQKKAATKTRVRVIPKNPVAYAEKLQYIVDAAGATEMLDFAKQRPLSVIGIDTEFQYSRPGVLMKRVKGKDLHWNDPRSIVPLLMSVAMAEIIPDGTMTTYPFVIDLRHPEVYGVLGELLRLPVQFAAHYVPAELMCIWQLNLPVPSNIWDTWVAEKAFCLGLHHARYENVAAETDLDLMNAAEEAEDKILS